jgi:hypothetical protein
MTRSTYFDLGRSADARPGSESGYAQHFQCGNVVKRLIGTGMKTYTSAEIHLVDVEMLFFDLFPCRVFAREVFDKANWNLVLHSLTVGLPNCTKEQDPSFTLLRFSFFNRLR